MMASVVVGRNRKKSLTLIGVDPATCMIVFKNHWTQVTDSEDLLEDLSSLQQVVKILEKHEPGRSGIGALSFFSGHGGSSSAALRLGPIPADEASAVQNYVEHMLFLLMEEEADEGGAMGPILEFVVLEGVMERLFLWSLRRQFTEDMKLEQLRMYQMLLSQARQPLLHHKPVLRPLMMLLASCAGYGSGTRTGNDIGAVVEVEVELVLLLNQLCVALVKDPSVLELFFHTSEDQGAANFLLFSLLIPYTHRQGSVGQQARDALLLIMSLTASDPRVAKHIADNTYFCPVLATGLSGLYSSLPARLQVYSDDWSCLDEADWQQVPALVHFLHSLDFCSAITKVAHPSIRSQLLGYIYNGFLVPVLAPALHKLTVEEVMTTTAYLELFLRSISEPVLLQTFLSFVLLHMHDNVHILDTLVSRVNTPFQLGTVSLALFRTLIGLFCEDVMLQLIFRYLVPCTHLNRKQRICLNQRHCFSSSAASFLRLLPSWCSRSFNQSWLEVIHWPKGADLTDGVGFCRHSDSLLDVNYLHYLLDARYAIATSQRACLQWSAPYDGMNPSPQEYRSDTPGDNEEDDVCSLLVALSPEPSYLDATSNMTGRTGSALELEWDDIFADDDASLLWTVTKATAPALPPRHIQEMQRTATRMIHGSYVEESEFQDDVLVYDLVAQKDTILVANQQVQVKTSRSVMETVNSIMSTRRRSDEGGKEDHWKEAFVTNVCSAQNDIIVTNHQQTHRNTPSPCLLTSPNCHTESESHDQLASPASNVANKDNFLSRYRELMLTLGVDADCDDITDDISTFRKRVRALRQILVEEELGLKEEGVFSWSRDDCKEEEGKEATEEEEEEEGARRDNRRHGVPFTGPFISVMLSRLENLLENSIAVNLLLTGILAQLASYPQPLLRSFLLSTDTNPQPNVRMLYQVLVSVQAQIERYVAARPEYPALLTQAWRFLLAKDQDSKFRECFQSQGDDIILEPSNRNGFSRTALAPPNHGLLPPCPVIPPHAKNRIFAIILFAEFLKELAAIAQEQSIALDLCTEE